MCTSNIYGFSIRKERKKRDMASIRTHQKKNHMLILGRENTKEEKERAQRERLYWNSDLVMAVTMREKLERSIWRLEERERWVSNGV